MENKATDNKTQKEKVAPKEATPKERNKKTQKEKVAPKEATPKERNKKSGFNLLRLSPGLLIAAGVLVFAFVFVFFINPFHFKFGFANTKLEIEKTTNLVTEIKKIAEFTTACFYEELVIQDVKYKYKERKVYKKSDNWWKRQIGKDKEFVGAEIDSTEIGKIVLIAKGKIRAGLDFSKLTENDFRIQNDTLYATLPPAEIFDIIINPSDIEFFHRDGNYWDDASIAQLVSESKDLMYKHAMDENILEKASKYGVEKMSNIFKTFGFKEAVVSIKEPEADSTSIQIKLNEIETNQSNS